MTTVKMIPTGSESAAPPAESGVAIDSKGRRLKLREPSILDEARLVRTLGDAASNQAYLLGYVMPAVMVESIDGEKLLFPSTEREVEAAIQAVGRHGLQAVMAHITAKAGTPGNAEADLKNSAGRPDSGKPLGS